MAKQKPPKSSTNPAAAAQTVKKQAVIQAKNAQSTTSIWDGWLPIAAVLAVTFLAFIQTFQSEFVNWDDDVNIFAKQKP